MSCPTWCVRIMLYSCVTSKAGHNKTKQRQGEAATWNETTSFADRGRGKIWGKPVRYADSSGRTHECQSSPVSAVSSSVGWTNGGSSAWSMDLTRQQQQQRSLASVCRGPAPFPRRPWMSETGVAAAAAASGNLGLKGVIAGTFTPSRSILVSPLRRERESVLSRSRDRSWPADLWHLSECTVHVSRKRVRESCLFFFWSQCTLANRTITREIVWSRSRAIARVHGYSRKVIAFIWISTKTNYDHFTRRLAALNDLTCWWPCANKI